MKEFNSISIVCYGEVLWDIFSGKKKPGGAPLNVAYHLSKMGLKSQLISRVGSDHLGKELLQKMQKWELSSSLLQRDRKHPTGTVVAEMDENFEMTYEIVAPVAWDFIQWEQRYEEIARHSDTLVFGSLAMRNTVSYETLKKLLSVSDYRVFDVNLRAPYYESEKVLAALKDTELLKLNQHELDIISHWIGTKSKTEKNKVQRLQDRFSLSGIIVTRGKDGATYYEENNIYNSPVFEVDVVDTVGSGDAFLSAFLATKLSGKDILQSLTTASILGAFVASQKGACPDYSRADWQLFLQGKGLNKILK